MEPPDVGLRTASSSSHALIGGMLGAMLAAVGTAGINGTGLVTKVVLPAVLAPIVAFALAGTAIVAIYRAVGHRRPGPTRRNFRLGQVCSGSLLAFSHGTNDAQKTMGVITLALIAHGSVSAQHLRIPAWVVFAAAAGIALGTYAGGLRIIRLAGTRIIRMDSAQGFAAEGSGAAVILVSSHFGFPLSTTQVISGGVVGGGATKRLSAVRWGVAGNIAGAWLITLPAVALLAALSYWLASAFGGGAVGPLVIGVVALSLVAMLVRLRRRGVVRQAPVPG